MAVTMLKLRAALIDGYISVLHGIHDGNDNYHHTSSNPQIEAYATQMYQYLEALVSDKNCTFPPELLKQMFELYIDIV